MSPFVLAGAALAVGALGFLLLRGLSGRGGGGGIPPGGLPLDIPTGAVPKGLTPTLIALAKKWAAARGLPPTWVLATIINESGGNPQAVGDQGRSYGLMQVNHTAHTRRLAAKGLTPQSLFDPETNISVGTEIMREFYDQLVKALAGRPPPADIGVLTRLMYRGPALVLKAIRESPPRDPTPTFPGGPHSALVWNQALQKVSSVA